MPSIEYVHPVPAAEADGWFAAMTTTYLDSVAAARSLPGNRRAMWPHARRWGARADGRWVATLATLPRSLTVPLGGEQTVEIPADALSMVSVAATHRRQGILTTMLSASLHQARERGDAVSILIAAEWPIYGRYGYSPAETTARYAFRPRIAGLPWTGRASMRQVDPAEFARVAPAVFERARRRRAGNIDRPSPWWDRAVGVGGFTVDGRDAGRVYLVHDGPAGPDGYVVWAPIRSAELDGTMGSVSLWDLSAADDSAYRAIWEYLSGLDLVEEITMVRRPVDEPLRWLLTDGRALRQTYAGDGLWLRLLDVPAALGARRYATPGRLVLEVIDRNVGDRKAGGFAAGRFVLDGAPDGASCRATGDSADLVLSQRALASAYLGGFSLRALAVGGGVEEQTAGALDRADAMFTTALAPWCATMF